MPTANPHAEDLVARWEILNRPIIHRPSLALRWRTLVAERHG